MRKDDRGQPDTAPLSDPDLSSSSSRVAVVHDWLTGMRGGEKVLEAILELFPQAEVFTLFHFPGSVSRLIEAHTIHTSPIQRLARAVSDYRTLLPLFPFAIRGWDFRSFDLVISSSHCVAKGVETGAALHVDYCHTPMRYIWDRFDDYFPSSRPLLRMGVGTVAPLLRRWDRGTVGRVDRFVANSTFVRDRIRAYYGRDASVVHPFVEGSFFEPPLLEERAAYHAMVTALVPYKRVDLAVEAARISGRKLVIIGSGPMEAELARSVPPNVELVGFVSTETMRERLRGAQSLIIPGVEDFGITALEAMAVGTPVVALGEGGVLDSVVDGSTGVLFPRSDARLLAEAMEAAERNRWDRNAIRQHAASFSKAAFSAKLLDVIREARNLR